MILTKTLENKLLSEKINVDVIKENDTLIFNFSFPTVFKFPQINNAIIKDSVKIKLGNNINKINFLLESQLEDQPLEKINRIVNEIIQYKNNYNTIEKTLIKHYKELDFDIFKFPKHYNYIIKGFSNTELEIKREGIFSDIKINNDLKMSVVLKDKFHHILIINNYKKKSSIGIPFVMDSVFFEKEFKVKGVLMKLDNIFWENALRQRFLIKNKDKFTKLLNFAIIEISKKKDLHIYLEERGIVHRKTDKIILAENNL